MYFEMVDEEGLAGCGRGLGQFLVAGQHVDEAGLADIGTANECVLRTMVYGALADECAALDVIGVFDVHPLEIIIKAEREPFLEHPIVTVMFFACLIFGRAVVISWI